MAIDRVRLARALSAIIADTPEPEELPERVCAACLTVLPVDGVGVTLVSREQPGGRALLGATDAVSTQIEELQFDLGEGPCVSASDDSRPILVADVGSKEARIRWPMFAHEAELLDVGAVFAFPLQLGASGIGVMDCHRVSTGPLGEVTETLAVADAVTLALLTYDAHLTEGTIVVAADTDLFDLSWRNHAEVHQATGAVAMQLHISPGDALARLRAYAFHHEQSLHAVAAEVMAGVLRLAQDRFG